MQPAEPVQHFMHETLARYREDFVRSVAWGEAVLAEVVKAQFQLSDIHPLHLERAQKLPRESLQARLLRERYWVIQARVPQHLRDGFGIAPEMLIIAVKGEVQARDLAAANLEILEAVRQAFIDDTERRLDPDLMVVVSDERHLRDRLEQLPAARGRCVPWQVETSDNGFGLEGLSDALWSSVTTYDVFDERDPVRGRHVIGRKDEIRRLQQQVLAGKSVGLFGLRKVGKTTIVRKVTDELDPLSKDPSFRDVLDEGPLPTRAVVFFTDAQEIVARSEDSVMEFFYRRIQARLTQAGIQVPPFQGNALERLERVLDRALEQFPQPLCLVIDEYDYLFEPQPVAGLAGLLRVLRAKAQSTQRLSVVVIGRDPAHFQQSRMEGAPNPMLGWFQETWIGPFDKEAANETLRKLGRRVGLEVGPQTLSVALDWTLGHPLLHRQFGSAFWGILRRGNKTPTKLPTDPRLSEALKAFCEKNASLAVCREIYALLSERYQPALELLRDLARERPTDAPTVIELHNGYGSPPSRVLRQFGLLGGTEQQPLLPELLRWYLKNEVP